TAYQSCAEMRSYARHLIEELQHSRAATHHTLKSKRGGEFGVELARSAIFFGGLERTFNTRSKFRHGNRLAKKVGRALFDGFKGKRRRIVSGEQNDFYTRIELRNLFQHLHATGIAEVQIEDDDPRMMLNEHSDSGFGISRHQDVERHVAEDIRHQFSDVRFVVDHQQRDLLRRL